MQVPLLLKSQSEYQKGWIGIALQSYWFEPLSNSKSDERAAERSIDFMLGWSVAHCTLALYILHIDLRFMMVTRHTIGMVKNQ